MKIQVVLLDARDNIVNFEDFQKMEGSDDRDIYHWYNKRYTSVVDYVERGIINKEVTTIKIKKWED